MVILDPKDAQRFVSLPTKSGLMRVLQHQGGSYILQKKCQNLQEAMILYRQNGAQKVSSLILKQPLPEVWIKVTYEQLLKTRNPDTGKLNSLGPLDQRYESRSSRSQTGPLTQRQLKPLVAHIEDSLLDGKQMEQVLKACSCNYFQISNPVLALPTLIERKPNLIFLDLVMPITNGYELCAQIKRVAQFKETPVVIVTSTDSTIDRARAKLVGAASYITKPITLSAIQGVLKEQGLFYDS